MTNHGLALGVACAGAAFNGLLAQPPAPRRPIEASYLSRKDAELIARAALDACEARHDPGVAYVFDADGNLRAAGSSDGADPWGMETASGKAAAVLAFHVSSQSLMDRAARDTAFATRFGKDRRYSFHGGALPLFRGTSFVGTVAVGGVHGIDEQCAQAGIGAVPWARSYPAAQPAGGTVHDPK